MSRLDEEHHECRTKVIATCVAIVSPVKIGCDELKIFMMKKVRSSAVA